MRYYTYMLHNTKLRIDEDMSLFKRTFEIKYFNFVVSGETLVCMSLHVVVCVLMLRGRVGRFVSTANELQ
jgi:hypothetical protein